MNTRRTMAAMLADIAGGAMQAAAGAGVRASRVEVNLPVEIVWTGGVLFAELPRNLTRTAFDAPPSRLLLVWEERP
jgi:hypothetical protein